MPKYINRFKRLYYGKPVRKLLVSNLITCNRDYSIETCWICGA